MSDQRPVPTEALDLGPFEVAADPAAITAFAAATGAGGSAPSATFPASWLSTPKLGEALRAAIGPDHLAVHESQSFDYDRPLRAGGCYILSASVQREAAPARLVIVARATEMDGAVALTMRSVMRLVSTAGERAG